MIGFAMGPELPRTSVQLLLERVARGWVAGVDHSQEMARQAAARNASALRNRRASAAIADNPRSCSQSRVS